MEENDKQIIVLECKHTCMWINFLWFWSPYPGEYDTKMYNRNISITVPPIKKLIKL